MSDKYHTTKAIIAEYRYIIPEIKRKKFSKYVIDVTIYTVGIINISKTPANFGFIPFSLVLLNLINGYLMKVLKSKNVLKR